MKRVLCLGVLALAGTLSAAPIRVLWWDSTPEYGSQASNSLRQGMSDYLTNFGGGTVFSSTYVGSETPGTLATQLAGNTYDVLVFDATTGSARFNGADLDAVRSFYSSGNNNLLFDGTLYIRSINYNATTVFPGVGDDTGKLTANEVYQLGTRGGGIMVGTDHECCQTDANQIVSGLIPSASFTGTTFPSTDGIWNGTDLLTGAANVVSLNVFNHWDSVPTEGVAPTGAFTDFLGNSINLYSQVDVADDPGGGPKFSYISTSWQPSGGGVIITDPDPGGGGGNNGVVPEPSTYLLMASALGALGWYQRRRRVV